MQNFKDRQYLLYLFAICLLCFFVAHSFYYFHIIATNTVFGYSKIKLFFYAFTDTLVAFFLALFIMFSLYKTIKNKKFSILHLFVYTCIISLFLILAQSFANNLIDILNQENNINLVTQLLYTIFLGLFIISLIASLIFYVKNKNNLSSNSKKIITTMLYCLFIVNCILFTILTFSNIQTYQNEIWDMINQPQLPEEFTNTLLNNLQFTTIIYKFQISIAIIDAILLTIAYIINLFKINNLKIKQNIIISCLIIISSLVLIYYLVFAIMFLILSSGFTATFVTQVVTISLSLLLILMYTFLHIKHHRTLPVNAE